MPYYSLSRTYSVPSEQPLDIDFAEASRGDLFEDLKAGGMKGGYEVLGVRKTL